MRGQGRRALVAAASVAVVAVVAVAWSASRPEPSAAAAGAPRAQASTASLVSSAPATDTALPPTLAPLVTKAAATRPLAVPTPSAQPTHVAILKPVKFPVPVSVGDAQQIITVSASGSYANVVAWQLRGGIWRAVISTKAARIGTHGVIAGSKRKQGTGTTPAGTFTMTEAFGISANPGTAMPYHLVTSDDWWVEDNNSAYYNQMRRASQGGFDTKAPPSSLNSSEHLITFTTQYRYVVVINFNRPPNAVRYRGAGIFLHVNGTGSTAGCVSVPLSTMVAIIKWLDPNQHPRIAIA